METFDKKMIGYVFHFMALHNFLYLLILFFFDKVNITVLPETLILTYKFMKFDLLS